MLSSLPDAMMGRSFLDLLRTTVAAKSEATFSTSGTTLVARLPTSTPSESSGQKQRVLPTLSVMNGVFSKASELFYATTLGVTKKMEGFHTSWLDSLGCLNITIQA
jgi:hypothetical protein